MKKHNHRAPRKPVMPMTASFQAYLNMELPERRYQGVRVKQDSEKKALIQRREARLVAIGWSLLHFTGNRAPIKAGRRF